MYINNFILIIFIEELQVVYRGTKKTFKKIKAEKVKF